MIANLFYSLQYCLYFPSELHYTNEEGVEADEGMAPKEAGKASPEPSNIFFFLLNFFF